MRSPCLLPGLVPDSLEWVEAFVVDRSVRNTGTTLMCVHVGHEFI